jgi:hypothetical protein
MHISYAGLELGDIVFYQDSNKGWIPAIVESIFPPPDLKGAPDVALVCMVTGYHHSTYAVPRAKHGKEKGEWLAKVEVKMIVEEKEKGLSEAAQKQLQELRDLERQAKAEQPPEAPAETPEPKPVEAKKTK